MYTIFIVLNRRPIKKLSQLNSLQSDNCFIVHKVACRKLTHNVLVAIIAAFQSQDCSSIWQLWETAVVLARFVYKNIENFNIFVEKWVVLWKKKKKKIASLCVHLKMKKNILRDGAVNQFIVSAIKFYLVIQLHNKTASKL